jgi:outer membrane receptor protein involved in Fe transport
MDQNSLRFFFRADRNARAMIPAQGKVHRISRNFFVHCLLLGLLALAPGLTHRLAAQTFAASITGTVTDQTGAIVSGAKVEIRNTGTNELRVLTSDASGLFTAEQLAPGQYSLSVTAKGFKGFVKNNITLEGSQRAEHDAQLQLGSQDQVVEVTASQISVDTQSANREVTMESEQIEEMPTSFRNPLYTVQSTAGVVSVRTGLNAYMTDQNQNRFSLNGGRDESTSVLVDGANIVAPDLGGAIATPTMDATAEVQVQRTAYDAQFTHTDGGVVSLITKSGTNKFHGSTFEYFRNDHLDANSWENKNADVARQVYQRNQFGGSVGGPVWKNKAFFFFAYDGLRQAAPDPYSTFVPTDAERTGDFTSSGVTIYDPFTLVNGQRVSFASEYGSNAIPADRMDAVGKTVASLFPEPNSTNSAYNYFVSSKDPSNYDKIDIRGDYVVSPNDTIFARITKAWQYNPAANYFPSSPAFNVNQGENDLRQVILLSNTWTPTPTWVVNAVVSYGKWTEEDTSPSFGHDPTALGFSSSTTGQWQESNAYPQFNFDNYSTLGEDAYADTPHETDGLQVNVSHAFSKHSLKFGFLGEIQRLYPSNLYSPEFYLPANMTGGPTPGESNGDSVASLLLGTGSSGSVVHQVELDLQQLNYGFYVQDTWRANDRLTVTAGLRWDIQGPRTERYNRLNNFDSTLTSTLNGTTLTGGLVYLNNSKRGLWDSNLLNFDPRVSFAYKLTNKLVARAGYGIFNPNTYAYSSDAQNSSDGYSATTNWEATKGGDGVTPYNLLANPYPNGVNQPTGSTLGGLQDVGGTLYATMRKHPNPYVQVYSLDFQYQVGNAGVLEAGYAGTLGRQLLHGVQENLNQLPSSYLGQGISTLSAQVANPYYGVITSSSSDLSGTTIPYWKTLVKYSQFDNVNELPDTPGSSSSFNALSLKYNQRFSYGLSAMVTYQWSKAIDDTSENNSWEVSDAVRDVFNPRLDRSLSAHDLPSAFAATINYELPVGRGKAIGGNMSPALNAVVGGWKASTILRFNDGLPIHLTETSSLGDYNYGVARPNITSEKDLAKGKGGIHHWFNTDAVTYASSGNSLAIGNAPRYIGSVRYAITKDTDLALEKNFALYRQAIFKFRAEAYNLSNTAATFDVPDVNLGDTAFGQITSTKSVGPRTIQLGARIEF